MKQVSFEKSILYAKGQQIKWEKENRDDTFWRNSNEQDINKDKYQ